MNKTQKKNNPQLKPFAPHRVRQVRPDLFKSETIADLSMTARFAFIGLMTCCDKHGRFEWKPRTLKSDILPHDNIDFESLLAELEKLNFVQKYPVGGHAYGLVTNWHSYQYIGVKESKQDAVYPDPWYFPQERLSRVPETTKNVPDTSQNVLDSAKTLGVGVDVGLNAFESVCVNKSVNAHSILPQNEGTNDSPYLSAKDAEKNSDIETLEKTFHRENEQTTFRPGRKQIAQLINLIGQHDLEIVEESVKIFATEAGHNWSEVICPAALYLDDHEYYIQQAIDTLECDKDYRDRKAKKRATQQAQAGT